MRWDHPEQGILTPDRFMAAFEDQDLSLKLGDLAFETALRQMRDWLDAGVEFGRVAVNISAAQFRSGRLAEEVQDRLKRWNVPCDRLTIEVTENVYMGWGSEMVSDSVRQLHKAGVMIALDDFGTGYASPGQPAPVPDRPAEDRQVLRPEHRGRRHREGGDHPGLVHGHEGRRRGRRGPGAAGRPGRLRLRPDPGVPLQPADAGGMVPGYLKGFGK
jgi:hypothetical protein